MLEIPEPWDIGQGKLLTQNKTSPREKSVSLPAKLEGIGDLKSILKSAMEMQSLEFMGWLLVLLWPVFLHYAPFPALYLVPFIKY